MCELNLKLKNYIEEFNKYDDEIYKQKYVNAVAFDFLKNGAKK